MEAQDQKRLTTEQVIEVRELMRRAIVDGWLAGMHSLTKVDPDLALTEQSIAAIATGVALGLVQSTAALASEQGDDTRVALMTRRVITAIAAVADSYINEAVAMVSEGKAQQLAQEKADGPPDADV